MNNKRKNESKHFTKEEIALENERKAADKLDRMNNIFDRLLVPIIIFTAAMIFFVGLIPKWVASCAADNNEPTAVNQSADSHVFFYSQRLELLYSIVENKELFESHGFYLMEDDSSGYIAYKKLDSGTEIMDNVVDQNGNMYTAITAEKELDGEQLMLTLMVYSKNVFIAIAQQGDKQSSAVFDNESFTAQPSDSDACAVLQLAPSEMFAEMLEEYKSELSELF